MKTVVLYSDIEQQQQLNYIFSVFTNTLKELNVDISLINISSLNIDFFNGNKNNVILKIFSVIENASSIVFVGTAKNFAISGNMQTFLEHFDTKIYKNILKQKYCFNIFTSFDCSEFYAGNYMNLFINSFLGINCGSMLIGKSYLENIENNKDIFKLIEKYAEDFYRNVKQNRKFFVAMPNLGNLKNIEPKEKVFDKKNVRTLNVDQVAQFYKKEDDIFQDDVDNIINFDTNFNDKKEIYKKEQVKDLTSSLNMDTQINKDFNFYEKQKKFTDDQKSDISEITKILKMQYKDKTNEIENSFNNKTNHLNNKIKNIQNVNFNKNTVRQKTQSIYHYFQPQMAIDLDIVIQLNISGEENFDGFFVIKDGECTYQEGNNNFADVFVLANSDVWLEILNGKYTLQKAFMMGKVKVKGNFILISKFEQLFKLK